MRRVPLFVGIPKALVRSWVHLIYKLIVEFFGGQKLLKSMGMLDHIKQRNDESLGDFYTRFNKQLI